MVIVIFLYPMLKTFAMFLACQFSAEDEQGRQGFLRQTALPPESPYLQPESLYLHLKVYICHLKVHISTWNSYLPLPISTSHQGEKSQLPHWIETTRRSIHMLHLSILSPHTWGRLASVERISASDCRGTWDLFFWDFFWDSFFWDRRNFHLFHLSGNQCKSSDAFLGWDSSKTNICHVLVGGVKGQHIFTVLQSFKESSQYIVAILWKIDKRWKYFGL